MFKRPTANQYRILYFIWMVAAAAIAVTLVRSLPEIQPMRVLLLALSLVVAFSSRRAWKFWQKKERSDRPNQTMEGKDNE